MEKKYIDSPYPPYFRREKTDRCKKCKGSGQVPVTSSGGTIKCPDCKGTGKIIDQ